MYFINDFTLRIDISNKIFLLLNVPQVIRNLDIRAEKLVIRSIKVFEMLGMEKGSSEQKVKINYFRNFKKYGICQINCCFPQKQNSFFQLWTYMTVSANFE